MAKGGRKMKGFGGLSAMFTEDITRSPAESEAGTSAETVSREEFDHTQQQADRLIELTRNRREQTGHSHAEAKEHSADFAASRSEIRKIKNRLHKLEAGEGTTDDVAEIKELRSSLAQHLQAMRKAFPVTDRSVHIAPTEAEEQTQTLSSSAVASPETATQEVPSTDDEELIAARNWDGLSQALRDREIQTSKDPAKTTMPQTRREVPEAPATTEGTATEKAEHIPKAYESRLEVRNAWRNSKVAYESAYEQYLKQQANRTTTEKLVFWKKDQQLPELQKLETQYQQARATYASILDSALTKRFVEGKANAKEQTNGMRAGLANRFVIHAAMDKLSLERLNIPEGNAARTLESVQSFFKKHGKSVRLLGYASAAGIGLATGGFAAGVLALTGKYARGKVALGGGLLGAAVGNYVGGVAIEHSVHRRDHSLRNAQHSFSLDRLDALEADLVHKGKQYEGAVRRRKYYTLAGSVVGSLAGAGLSGAAESLTEAPGVPETPPDHATVSPEHNPADTTQRLQEHLRDAAQSTNRGVVDIGQQEVPNVPHTEVGPEAMPQQPYPNGVPHAGTVSGSETMPSQLHAEQGPEAMPQQPYPYRVPHAEVTTDSEYPPQQPYPNRVPEPNEVIPHSEVPFTFQEGSATDTVSEALYTQWETHPDFLTESMSKHEFLSKMYQTMDYLDKHPQEQTLLLEQMGVTSGDIDAVFDGQTINLRPFYEYMSNNNAQ